MTAKVELLHPPGTYRTVDEALGAAGKLNLENVLILSEGADGALVIIDTGLTVSEANWLLDCVKHVLQLG